MQAINEKFSRVIQTTSIWISLLLHILLLSYFLISVKENLKPVEEKDKPGLYVPAYTYQEPMSPPAVAPKILPVQTKESPSPLGIMKPAVQNSKSSDKAQSMRAVENSPAKNTEPIHLIGDQKNTPKPLIKLLAKALTASLIYPKMAVDFHLQGVAYIEFTIHPDGQISNIHLVKSSSTSVLDQAALDAVQAISPLNGVSQFLSQPKSVVFGFIFG